MLSRKINCIIGVKSIIHRGCLLERGISMKVKIDRRKLKKLSKKDKNIKVSIWEDLKKYFLWMIHKRILNMKK